MTDTHADDTVILYVPNPRYPGDIPSSSSEERKAMGYPDLPITIDDLRANAPAILDEIVQGRLTPHEPDE